MNYHSVDQYYVNNGQSQLLCDNSICYSCVLNKTEIDSNKNRFYVLQIIKCGEQYYVYRRYGRIGEDGKTMTLSYKTKNAAIKMFKSQFKNKTGILWDNRKKFAIDGKYIYTDIEINNNKEIQNNNAIKSKLSNDIQNLIKLISDKNMIYNALVDLNIDTNKMPIGQLSLEQLEKGKYILDRIEKYIDDNNNNKIKELSDKYYKIIPYSCGRKKPELINNKIILNKMYKIIRDIQKIKDAMDIIKLNNLNINPIDSIFNNLDTKIQILDKQSLIYKQLYKYYINTHGPTHNFKLNLIDIYEIENVTSREFNKNINNIQLLFHGSRMCNYCSILKNGLVLNPNLFGAHITGKMFGSGIYFTNSISKSAQYCGVDDMSNGKIILMLAEVALGNKCEKIIADPFITNEILNEKDYHSVMGMGRITVKTGVSIDDIYIPNGKLIRSNINSVLNYDEYVVYSTTQINPKYLMVLDKILKI